MIIEFMMWYIWSLLNMLIGVLIGLGTALLINRIAKRKRGERWENDNNN